MEKNKNKTSVGVPQNASCWICRRTHKEVDDFYFSVTIDTKDGELPKWLCLAHIIPINYEGKLNEAKGFFICPFCREAMTWSWFSKYLGNEKDKDDKQ